MATRAEISDQKRRGVIVCRDCPPGANEHPVEESYAVRVIFTPANHTKSFRQRTIAKLCKEHMEADPVFNMSPQWR